MHTKLQALDKIEAKAFRVMMRGSEEDACAVRGKEGKNWLAWDAATKDCYRYREEHGLIGRRGY